MKIVKEIMTKDVITVSPHTSVREVVSLLLQHHFSGIPVVSENNELVGIVTEADLLYRIKLPAIKILLEKEEVYCDPKPIIHKYRKIGGQTAQDVMSSNPVVISEEENIESAVDQMIHHKVNPIPVIRSKKLVGIISRSDIMQFILKQEREFEKHKMTDEEISELVSQVLKKGICLPIANLKVSSQNGIISLNGEIDSKENLELLTEVVKSIRGVKKVENDLLINSLVE
jgi:CBS domain-containing protein